MLDSDAANVRRLESLRALLDFELDLLTFLERPPSVHLDGGVMDEDIGFSIGLCDEPEALR